MMYSIFEAYTCRQLFVYTCKYTQTQAQTQAQAQTQTQTQTQTCTDTLTLSHTIEPRHNTNTYLECQQ